MPILPHIRYDYEVDYEKELSNLNSSWALQRAAFTKAEIAHIGDKDTFRGKLHGFLTNAYYKRKKLIQTGELVYGLAIKSWSNDLSPDALRFRSWVIFSPSLSLRNNPDKLEAIGERLLSFMHEGKPDKSKHSLYVTMNEPLSDASYLELPEDIAGGELVYLSIIYVETHLNPNFALGPNIVIISPSVSKEVLYLPEEYWPKGMMDAYKNRIKPKGE